jgi:hypothetical protein
MNNKIILFSLILLLLISVAGCTYHNSEDYEPGELELLEERTFKIAPGEELHVDASVGDVIIRSWEKPEVAVKIMGNRKAAKKMEFFFNNDENVVEIEAENEGSFFNFFSSGIVVVFEITVPEYFNTEAFTSGGDITVSDVEGDNYLNTSGGDLKLKNLKGKLDASTSGGDILLDSIHGDIEASTSGGNIEGRNSTGDLRVSTSGGDISLISSDSRIAAETSGGNIALEYGGKNLGIELVTSGGDIVVRLPEDFNASARMHTSGGSINCAFTANKVINISSSEFEADLNIGGAALNLETSGGDIVVARDI